MAYQGAEKLEKRVNAIYRQHSHLAERFHFVLNRPVVSVGGRPNVVFLGNHSAGKSTFINYLLGGDVAVQDTGVAPTDDGFTVLMYGEKEEDYLGPAGLPYLSDDFCNLERLGPAFLRRLRVKIRCRSLLKLVNLIDSPGMIDAAQAQTQRDYDFVSAVRTISDVSDLVLFLFDPDKPGTTGEAISILKDCLTGMEFKLRILMNKADTFDSMYDFARAYGALCWNLARALHTKDLPPVYTTYIPVPAAEGSRLELRDFDRYRNEVIEQVRSAQQRRSDNMIAALRDDMSRLAVHVRMLTAVRRKLFLLRIRQFLLGAGWVILFVLFSMILVTLFTEGGKWTYRIAMVFTGILAGAVSVWRFRGLFKVASESLYDSMDMLFREVYVNRLTMGQCDDLLAYWHAVKGGLPKILRKSGKRVPMCAFISLKRLERAIRTQITGLKT